MAKIVKLSQLIPSQSMHQANPSPPIIPLISFIFNIYKIKSWILSLQWSGSRKSSIPAISFPNAVSVPSLWFLPKTEEIVSCTFPNLYQSVTISNLLSISRHTEFPIWSIPTAIERIIELRYPSDFFPAFLQWGNRNLTPISTSVHRMPSGSSTTARAPASKRRSRLYSSFFICCRGSK